MNVASLKPGIRSTEFWIMMVCQVVGLLFDSGIFGAGPVGLAIGAALHIGGLLGYAPGRAKVKAAHAEAQARVQAETIKQLDGMDAEAKAKILGGLLGASDE